MRKLLLIVFAIIGAIYVYLVAAVEDDKQWFHSFSQADKTSAGKLKFDSLQYSAYRWRTHLQSGEWELFLAYYIKIDKEGNYIAMRHNTTIEPAMYFKGKIDNSVQHPLDSLSIVPLDTFYIKPELRIHDGNTFRLTYRGRIENNIEFYQVDSPSFLQRLSTILDTVIFNSKQQIPPFDLFFHEQLLKQQSHAYLEGLPKKAESPPPPNINVEKYNPSPNKSLPIYRMTNNH